MNGNEAADDERPGNVRPGFFFHVCQNERLHSALRPHKIRQRLTETFFERH